METMPWGTSLPCEGTPNARCPKKKGTPTRLSQGDMMLCKSCEAIRFPLGYSAPEAETAVQPEVTEDIATPPANPPVQGFILSQLETCDDLCHLFVEQLDIVYSYSASDINCTLNKLSIDALKLLHKSLWDRTKATFEPLRDRKAIVRQVKHTIVPDIYQFGLSLVNKHLSKDLDKAYVNREMPTEPDTPEVTPDTELAKVLQIVVNLQQKVSVMEKELSAVKQDNKFLHTRLSTS